MLRKGSLTNSVRHVGNSVRSALMVGLCCVYFQACKPMTNQHHTGIEFQGHRGARGLYPENTLEAFRKCLDYGITTLELDVVISADSQVVVSHEAWFSSEICSKPSGEPITASEEKGVYLFQLPYDTIKTYDCGKRGHPRFPEQVPLAAYKPLLTEVIRDVQSYAKFLNLPDPKFNIELKTEPALDGIAQPEPAVFAQLVYRIISLEDLQNDVVLQSFDPRILEALRDVDSTLTMAFLVENDLSLEENLSRLRFTPAIYSPYYQRVTPSMVELLRKKSMSLTVWTVNDTAEMSRLIDMGVKSIITDYPDRAQSVLRSRAEP